MEKAIQNITTRTLGVRSAASEYQVPHSKFRDHIIRWAFHGATQGPPKYLSEDEEGLFKWITGWIEVGYAKSVHEIRAVVRAIVLNKLGMDNPIVVSHRCWVCFHQHRPHFVLHAGEGIALKWSAAINKTTFDHY